MATAVRKMDLYSVLKVTERFSGTLMDNDDKDVLQKIEDNVILKSDTTPDVEYVYAGNQALVAGAKTINLTALTDGSGATIASTGKKVRAVKFKAKSTNTSAIVIKVGASNGYQLLAAGWQISLGASDHALFYLGTHAPDIGPTALNIDMTGTGTESVDMIIVFG